MTQRVSVFASWSACSCGQSFAQCPSWPQRKQGAASGQSTASVPTLFAIAADNLSAVTRPMPKEPAPKALVRWASLPAAPAVSCGFSRWAFVGTAVVVAVLWWENEDVVRLNHDWRSAAFELDRHALMWRWRRAQDDATPTVELVAQKRVQLHAAGANEAA